MQGNYSAATCATMERLDCEVRTSFSADMVTVEVFDKATQTYYAKASANTKEDGYSLNGVVDKALEVAQNTPKPRTKSQMASASREDDMQAEIDRLKAQLAASKQPENDSRSARPQSKKEPATV